MASQGYVKTFTKLIVFVICSVIGLLIFTRGFLLSRTVITSVSSAYDVPSAPLDPSAYDKVVLLVIDALRYDFAAPQPETANYYHNQLPIINQLLNESPHNAKLYKFIADPPTTTMQRLKGLTTGSLPTFVDAGSNFASSEIMEDNIIDQLLLNNKSIVFMGDDTWESLFPGRFTRSYPFPSFNVQDLHTVDTGVKENLLPEIKKSDWTMLIGHFLGVDHCGHRYGPNHPAMSEKLAEMNDVIVSVIDAITDNTLLIIMGDHGMTRTGDHGGDSDLEVEAALFAYTKKPRAFRNLQEATSISQIDLVPTVSLMLDIPIPYSNLGSVILDFFPSDQALSEAFYLNQKQISKYLKHYEQICSDLPRSEMARLQELENSTYSNTLTQLQKVTRYQEYIIRAKAMCQDIWAKFNDTLMVIGSLQVLFMLILHGAINFIYSDSEIQFATVFSILQTLTSLILSYLAIGPVNSAVILILQFVLGCWVLLRPHPVRISFSYMDVFACAALILLGLGSLSNSLVVYEEQIVCYLLQSMILALFLTHVILKRRNDTCRTKSKDPESSVLMIAKLPVTYLSIVLGLLLYIAQIFNACREEQETCEQSSLLTPLSALHPDQAPIKNARYFFMSVPSVFILWRLTTVIHKVRGNRNGRSITTLVSNYVMPAIAFVLCAHWALSATPPDSTSDWIKVLPARLIYILVIGALSAVFISPLAVYYTTTKPKRKSQPVYDNSVPSLYQHLRDSYNISSQDEYVQPLVYGLGSVLSASYLVVLSIVSCLLMMLAGDGIALSILLIFLTILVLLDMRKVWPQLDATGIAPVSVVVTWVLLSKYFFFYTAHEPTMPNIRWDAAFQGFAKDHGNHVIPAILLFSSTFSSQLIFTIGLPLLLIVPESCQFFYQVLRSSGEMSRSDKGEIVLIQKQDDTLKKLKHLFMTYLLTHLIKAVFSLLSAALLRRHLMVWKIFAPAFVYEGASYILVCLISLLSYLLFWRVAHSAQKFLSGIELDHVD